MKQTIKNTLRAMLIVPLLALGVAAFTPTTQSPAYAATTGFDKGIGDGATAAQGTSQEGNAACLFGGGSECDGNDGIFKTVTNVLLFLVGAISVIMLIIGGIRYTVSGGDTTAVTSAKNTILYAVVGILVSILAFAVVNFVVGSFAA